MSTASMIELNTVVTYPDNESGDAALVTVMQRRGTRDALLVTIAKGGLADHKALLARLVDFQHRNEPTVMLTIEAFNSLLATTALLHWVTGDPDAALEQLGCVAGQHRMTELLTQLLINEVPGDAYLAGLSSMTVEECLAFEG